VGPTQLAERLQLVLDVSHQHGPAATSWAVAAACMERRRIFPYRTWCPLTEIKADRGDKSQMFDEDRRDHVLAKNRPL
jgi:hypothetical protein